MAVAPSYRLKSKRTLTSHKFCQTSSLEVVARADGLLLGHADRRLIATRRTVVQAALLRVLLGLVHDWAADWH